MVELAAEFGAAAGITLDENLDAVGHVEVVDHAGSVVETTFDARAGVRPEVDVDVRHPEFGGRVEFRLHAIERFLPEVIFRRTEVDEI